MSESIELTTLGDNNAAAAVVNLRGEVYSSSAVEIFWDVDNAPAGIVFDIFRDGQLVASTDGRSFFEDGLASGTAITYTVEPQIAGASATVTLTTLGGISTSGGGLDVSGIVYSSSALEVFWQRLDAGVSYRIERDGQLLDERDGLSFFDSALSAATTFIYSISALAADGSVISNDTITLTTQPTSY